MTTADIEKRMQALEAQMKSLEAGRRPQNLWWNKIAGVFANNPRFSEAMRLGSEDSGAQGGGKKRRTRRKSNSRGGG